MSWGLDAEPPTKYVPASNSGLGRTKAAQPRGLSCECQPDKGGQARAGWYSVLRKTYEYREDLKPQHFNR